MGKTSDVTIPGQPQPGNSSLIRSLTVVASGLTAASLAINLILQIAQYSKKRPVAPDQRDKLTTASLVLTILKTAPGLIKQTRLFVDQFKRAA